MPAPSHASLDLALESEDFRSRYEPIEVIASGGFGRVFRARQRSTGQQVAVKVIAFGDGDDDDDGEAIQLFRQELEVCASLHHPNVVRLIDSGGPADSARATFAVFELIPGSTLADVIGAEGALPAGEALHLMGQVLDALACAHGAGVVHRDLKPSNVMVTPTGARRNALVLDFGLGTFYERERTLDERRSRRWAFLGTPAYAAPEQLRGEEAGPRSDLFAWGLLLLECLTGRPVLEGPVGEVIHRQLSGEPIAIPAALRGLPLGRLLASVTDKDPSRRPSTAADVLEHLRRIDPEALPRRERLAGWHDRESGPQEVRSDVLDGHWLVPFHRNPNFTGREGLIARVHAALHDGRGLPVVALAGMGGVGKSQLALEYAYRYGYEYDVVAWLRAETLETLGDELAALAPVLGLREGDTLEQGTRVQAVRSWLERHGRWLLIFDNAQNPDAIRRFLPRVSTGHVLVTSRHPSWRSLGATLEVDELSLDEAVGFLLRRTGGGDRHTARQLAEALGMLPLALEAAAAYLETTNRSLEGYRQLLEARQRLPSADAALPGLVDDLRGAWELSFEALEKESPEAGDLLRLLAFLAPDEIPFSLVEAGSEHLPDALGAAVASPVRRDACVAALRRFSLIKVQGDSASIHRLVQRMARARLAPAAHEEWAGRALRVVEATFPRGLAGDFFQSGTRTLLPHAVAVLAYEQSASVEWLTCGRLRRSAGLYLSALGLQADAAGYLERALEHFESGDDSRESEQAGTLADLGLVLFALGDLDGAARSEERALAMHERLLGPRHLRTAVDLMSLAWVRRSQGRCDEVIACCERSHEIASELLGEKHPVAAMPLGPLARAHWGLGRIGVARSISARAIALLEGASVHHPLVCACWYSLAQVEFDLGHTGEAERCADLAIEIGERAYGRRHPQVAVGRVVRGMVHLRRGELDAAAETFLLAIEAGEWSCHRQHEDMAIARCLLARVQRLQGDREAAAASLERARATLVRVCGERTRSAAQVEFECGLAAFDEGDAERAAWYAAAALAALTGYPAVHPYRIPALTLLARAEQARGRRSEAAAAARRALALGDGVLDAAHPDLEAAQRALAEV